MPSRSSGRCDPAPCGTPNANTACRLCDAADLRLKHQVGRFVVQECCRCGFIQVKDEPRREDLAELYSPTYFDHGKYSDAFALRKENDARMALIRRQGVTKGGRMLDLGCATGDFMTHARRYYDVWGLDVSEFAVSEARQKNEDVASQIRSGAIQDQDFPSDFFDAIVMWDVLEHLWDPVDACTSVRRILKPGGYLFLSTPNIGAPVARLMGRYWAFMTVPEHLGFCNRKTMTFLLEERLGLTLVEWQTKGKWANFGFLLYKLQRIFPRLVPQAFVAMFRSRFLQKLAVYVPTGDIQYAVARKPHPEKTR